MDLTRQRASLYDAVWVQVFDLTLEPATSELIMGTTPPFPPMYTTSVSASVTPTHTTIPTHSEADAGIIHMIGPHTVDYCSEIIATWTGGTPPYKVMAFSTFYAPQEWQATVNHGSFNFWNGVVHPGKFFQISVTDYYNNTDYLMYTVSGTGDSCPWMFSTSSASNIPQTTFPNGNHSALSTGAIVGIIFAILAFLTIIGMAVWCFRKISSPRRIQADDHASLISGRSRVSLWSRFSRRNDSPNTSVEEGVRVDAGAAQVMEEHRTPTALQSITPFFTIRRTPHERNGDPSLDQNREDAPQIALHRTSDTHLSSIPEATEYSSPFPSDLDSTLSPFDDAHEVSIESSGPLKVPPASNGHTAADADAPQLSSEELEALADMVAARLHQRIGYSSAHRSLDSHSGSEELPRYS